MKNKKHTVSEDNINIKKNVHSENNDFSQSNKNTKIIAPKVNFFKRMRAIFHKQSSNKADSNNYPLW